MSQKLPCQRYNSCESPSKSELSFDNGFSAHQTTHQNESSATVSVKRLKRQIQIRVNRTKKGSLQITVMKFRNSQVSGLWKELVNKMSQLN